MSYACGVHCDYLRTLPLLLLLGSAAGCEPAEPGPPDLVLITIDSLRTDRLACYGGPAELGLHTCALADEGALFVWAFTAAPSGAPAAASVLTSLYPRDHGVQPSPATFLPSSAETLAEELARRGYSTAAFVSSPELNHSRNLQQGFAVYDDRLERQGGGASRDAATTTEAALRWLEATPSPRFVWVHYADLHGPFSPPMPSYEAYEARYRRSLVALDGSIERLLGHWAGLEIRPGVLVAGLHGESAGEAGEWFTHGHALTLELIRVPLIWRPPGLPGLPGPAGPGPPSAFRVVAAVSLLDAGPTLLAAAGAAPDDAHEGEALPLGGDPAHATGRAIFAERPDQLAVVTAGTYYARDLELGSPARFAPLPADGAMPQLRPALSTDATGGFEANLRAFAGPSASPEPSVAPMLQGPDPTSN